MAARRDRMATKDSWKTEPLPEQYTTLQLNHTFSKDSMNRIKKGVIPEEMEDKWFMYYDSTEDKLYVHRSWTGFLIYVIQFEERDHDTFVATNAVVNEDPSQYHCSGGDEEKERLLRVVKGVLLFDWS